MCSQTAPTGTAASQCLQHRRAARGVGSGEAAEWQCALGLKLTEDSKCENDRPYWHSEQVISIGQKEPLTLPILGVSNFISLALVKSI